MASRRALSIHRKFSSDHGGADESFLDLARAMHANLDKRAFMLISKFLVNVLHNIRRNPASMNYRRVGTNSKTIRASMQTPEVLAFCQKIHMQTEGEKYVVYEVLAEDILEEAETSLIQVRKDTFIIDAWEIFPRDLVCVHLLGAGSFGDVYSGTYAGQQVAVKTMKSTADEQAVADFFQEADIMKLLKHQNVLGLVGVSLNKKPHMIVMDLMKENLQETLRHDDFELDRLLTMATQVCAGIEYIHHQEVIHCDIAARNILVSEAGVLKLADFGLARRCQGDDTCSIADRSFPISVRWAAPDVWRDRIVARHTDVWSLGVVLFEIMTAGQVPYRKWKMAKVKDEVEAGYRLEQPQGCPNGLYAIMNECWQADASTRPTARDVYERLAMLKVTLAAELAALSRSANRSGSIGSAQQHQAEVTRREKRSLSWSSPFKLRRRTGSHGNAKQDGRKSSAGELGDLAEDPSDSSVPPSPAGPPLSPLSQSSNLLGSMDSDGTFKEKPRWFQGRRATKRIRECAEPALSEDGDFMLHETNVAGQYMLSVLWRTPLHIPMEADANGRFSLSHGKTDVDVPDSFASPDHLVSFYLQHQIPVHYRRRNIYLRRPVSSDAVEEDAQSLLQKAERQARRASSSASIGSVSSLPSPHKVDGSKPTLQYSLPDSVDVVLLPLTPAEEPVCQRLYAMLNEDQIQSFWKTYYALYDLAGVPRASRMWFESMKRVVERARAVIIAVTETGIESLATDSSWMTSLLLAKTALSIAASDQTKSVVVALSGRYLTLQHPTKRDKTFRVFEEFDLKAASEAAIPDVPHPDGEGTTLQAFVQELLEDGTTSIALDPERDDTRDFVGAIAANAPSVDKEDVQRFLEQQEDGYGYRVSMDLAV